MTLSDKRSGNSSGNPNKSKKEFEEEHIKTLAEWRIDVKNTEKELKEQFADWLEALIAPNTHTHTISVIEGKIKELRGL